MTDDATYVCPQCGPDPRGAEVHAMQEHAWPSGPGTERFARAYLGDWPHDPTPIGRAEVREDEHGVHFVAPEPTTALETHHLEAFNRALYRRLPAILAESGISPHAVALYGEFTMAEGGILRVNLTPPEGVDLTGG